VPLIYTIAAVSIVFASFTAMRQTDFKRIIAYTSIAHMNVVIIGIFSFNTIGLEGSILQSLSHGFVASALFLIIGVVYDRHQTKIVTYYGGLASVMPVYSMIFLFFTMANISFPGTSNFIGEFLILTGSFKVNKIITLLSATSIVIGSAYSLWLFNRICFGNLKTQYMHKFLDLNIRESLIFSPLILGTLGVGILPEMFSKYYHVTVNNFLELLYFKKCTLLT
jgi:NADH:ubiquinone oxidoreductase subunit 4 (subunit M)